MAQIISCQCGQRFSAADHLAGKAVNCPVCRQLLRVPAITARDSQYIIALLSGTVGGFLIGNRYCVPGMIGFAIAAVGSLFAASLPLYFVESIHSVFIFALLALGMVPGALIYRGLKHVQELIMGT